ncbi:MAG: ParB/RepB/Spo0J family partition protein [Bacteroidales bacterium]|nr:ParB/RepB/Spo0J family partition protein [Bacteroidales bacterium]
MAEEQINSFINESEHIIEIEIDRLRDFQNHPFKVQDDDQMELLRRSIEKYGILTPLIVRPKLEGYYEIISGHRRRFAAKKLGYLKVPVIIRTLNHDEAILCMVDANFQRENIAPSEKAFAYKMKYNAIKRKGHRLKKGEQNDNPYKGKKSIEVVGELMGDSPKQVQRYLKLTELLPELLEKLDRDELAFNPAYAIAFLKKRDQELVLDAMEYTQATPSLSQAQRIKLISQNGVLTWNIIADILGEIKQDHPERVLFKTAQLREYFPKDYTVSMMKEEIITLLKERMNKGEKTKGDNKHV